MKETTVEWVPTLKKKNRVKIAFWLKNDAGKAQIYPCVIPNMPWRRLRIAFPGPLHSWYFILVEANSKWLGL